MSELSRTEDILKGNEVVPQSRVEVLLKEIIEGGGGGSTVTVTPVLQAGVRLATINVDGTDYNIYAPEDVVGSIVTVDPELESGTLLATITVNDVPYYIYAPEETKEIYTGFTEPSASLGSDGAMYVKYNGDQETESASIWTGRIDSTYYYPQWTKVGDFNPLDYYRLSISGNSSGFNVNESKLVSEIVELSEQGSYWNAALRLGFKIENNALYFIQTYRSGTSYLSSVSGTKLIAEGVDAIFSKNNGTWLEVSTGSSGFINTYGYAAPLDSTGSNGDIYGKIEDVSGEEECIEGTPPSGDTNFTVHLPRDIDNYTSFTLSGTCTGNGNSWTYDSTRVYNIETLGTSSETATSIWTTAGGNPCKVYKSNGELVFVPTFGKTTITSLIGTYTSAHKVTDIYQKVEGHWSKYDKGEYSETVLWDQSDNPTTSSGDFTLSDSVENYDAIAIFGNGAGDIVTYSLINTTYVPRGQLRYNVPYLCNASFSSERRPWISFTDSTHITIGLHGSGAAILTVVGIKFGGSGGGSEQTPSLYNFYKSNDGTIIIRTGPDGTYWFFNGYTLTTSHMAIPEELQMYKPTNTDVILSDAYVNASDTTASGWIGFYDNTIRAWNTTKAYNITGTFYGVVKIDGVSSQTNGYYNAYDGIPNASGTNYSTAEQVIGTWIDGKPIYQKTILIDGTYNGDASVNISTNIPSNIDLRYAEAQWAYQYEGTWYYYSLGQYLNYPYENINTVKLSVGSVTVAVKAYLTIRYTKTTD